MVADVQHGEALVLRYTNYGEADRILTLLTAEHGLQRGFARSARNSRKRFSGTLEPFCRAIFSWNRGRGTLWSLRDAELISSHNGLRSDLLALALASYGVELVELLLEEGEPQPIVYAMLCNFLEFLARGGDGPSARVLLELRLSHLLGYLPHLLHCSECQRVFKEQEAIRFCAQRGGSLCLECAGRDGLDIALGSVGSLARSLKTAPWLFDNFRFGEQTCRDASLLLADVLQQILPREPKSLRFLSSL